MVNRQIKTQTPNSIFYEGSNEFGETFIVGVFSDELTCKLKCFIQFLKGTSFAHVW